MGLPVTFEIEEYLKSHSIKVGRRSGDEVAFCCPWHDDSNPSAFVNSAKGVFNCFACNKSGKLVELISYVSGIPEKEAESLISTNKKEELDITKLVEEKLNYKKPEMLPKIEEVFLDESMLAKFDYGNYKYLKGRGFSEDVLIDFEIGFYKGFVTIPVRNEKDKLVAILARPTDEIKEGWSKYFPLLPKKGYEKGRILYGLNKVSKKEKVGILVEGNLDAIKIFQFKFKNAVAIQGSHFSDQHEKLVLRWFDELILALDNDKAGQRAFEQIYKKLVGKITLYKFVYVRDNCKDIGEMSEEEFIQGIRNKELVL